MNNLTKLIAIGAIGLSSIVGCTTSTYGTINRFEKMSNASARQVYDSISEESLSENEKSFIKFFRSLPKEDQRGFLEHPILKEYKFLDKENPSEKEAVFLYNIQKKINEYEVRTDHVLY